MRVVREAIFAAPAADVWKLVQSAEHLQRICRPVLTFTSATEDPLPSTWNSGDTVAISAFAFGMVPLGVHTIYLESVDHDAMTLQTREHEPLVRTWDHRITVEDAGPDRCRYSDEIVIHAGVFTLSVWLFAQLLFANRHRQWKRFLAARR